MHIYLVRHGETDWNQQKKVMGRADIPLNAQGIEQAQALASILSNQHFDVIYTSPLQRAKKTAEIIARHLRIPIIEHPGLLERNYGSLAGKNWQEIEKIHRSDAQELDRLQQYDYTAFNGERAGDVQKRVENFLAEIKLKNHIAPLVICHGGIIRMLQHLLHGAPEKMIDNGSVHVFDI